MKWYVHALKNYATFQGRAARKEYWMFVLFNFIIWCVLSVIELITDIPPFLRIVYLVAVFIPSLAVTARRLRKHQNLIFRPALLDLTHAETFLEQLMFLQ